MLHVAAEVDDALSAGRPVVALESTIIAHGLPHPDSLDVAHALEAEVRAGGAVPATIAIIDGIPRIGLDAADLTRLSIGAGFAKAGAGDLAAIIAGGADAATTVSATAVLAAGAGIRLFATGGIGGVHRGDSFDISNDLDVLAQTPIAVVSSGAKSILDLPRTLERLETLGVPVIGYQTTEFPAFYSRSSGLRVPHVAADADHVARILAARFDLLHQGGVLIANPIPAENELDSEYIANIIATAHERASQADVRGKALTPYLLAAIAEATGGRAVAANRALAVHNARVAAAVASAYSRLR